MTTRPVLASTFCFVDVTLFMSGLPVSLITGVPMPATLLVELGSLENEIAPSGESFSRMSPLDCPLVLGGWGPVANIRATRFAVRMGTAGRGGLWGAGPHGGT